jgi:MraZ protein
VFRGFGVVSLDLKGRLAIPSRYRERLQECCGGCLVLTLNPLDRSLWIYPLPEWEAVEEKLKALSDFDRRSRRTKQMMRGYATDLDMDGQGRILLPAKHRELAGLDKNIVVLGQGNKFELWDEEHWNRQRDEYFAEIGEAGADQPGPLLDLSL